MIYGIKVINGFGEVMVYRL